MNAPPIVPRAISRRGESLGTENAFVVLAEVNALVRQGRDIVSFCIGQPDFPTPENIQDAAIAAIRGGKHGYTPSAGIDELRAAAATNMGARRGLDIAPERRRRRRGREAVHRLHDRVGDRLRRRRRGDLSGARIPDLRIADPRQRRGAGARSTCARRATSRSIRTSSRRKITPKTRLLILNYAAQSDRRQFSSRGDLDAIAEILRAAPAGLGLRRRDLFAPALRRRVRSRSPRSPGMLRAHDHLRRRVEDLGDDRLAHRLRRQPDAGAGVHALDHQHRIVRVADQPVGGGRGDQRSAGRGGGDARIVPRAPRI